MTKLLQIGSQTFEYPEQGNGNWGEEPTAWAEAVTDALASVQGPNDVLLSTANIQNNITSPTNITNLVFDSSEVLSIVVDFFVVRQYNPGGGPVALTESGQFIANYDGVNWFSVQEAVGDSGVNITIDATGQVQYTSTNLTGHIASTMRYRGKTIDKP